MLETDGMEGRMNCRVVKGHKDASDLDHGALEEDMTYILLGAKFIVSYI